MAAFLDGFVDKVSLFYGKIAHYVVSHELEDIVADLNHLQLPSVVTTTDSNH